LLHGLAGILQIEGGGGLANYTNINYYIPRQELTSVDSDSYFASCNEEKATQ
jgi:hypothetical protein